ncbi:hypothetical protein [Streptomyces solicathayae]|uniref:Integral membrane protein n=1 Tax=Streptomyces solicathayae TaxID=3081768 RepID=A0ABZ0LY05_9ACTN|nr:hypothetical protein [Streptomyces sp. HUAS YS2]WOX24412.1 hypothetical protein R2D22_24730 [Streptomyces sp. HUAS YS2]
MPDDVGGKPFQDGGDPEDSVDRGGADEDFASVVFDEDFVRAAEFHEPTAVERLLAAAQARAEADAARARAGGGPSEDELYEDGYGPGRLLDHDGYGDEDDDDSGPYGRHGGALRPYRNSARWHRPVAWVLALVMGVGMVALAFTAVYRGATANRQDPAPAPTTTSGIDIPSPGATSAVAPAVVPTAVGPSASTPYPGAPVPAVPPTP